MTVDTAIQHMLFRSTDMEIADLAWCANRHREDTIQRFCNSQLWRRAECEEFLDNIALAYELLVKDVGAI